MPRKRTEDETEVKAERKGPLPKPQFQDDLPKKRSGIRWWNVLITVAQNPGQWALVATLDDAEAAMSAQSNLKGRRVIIPESDGNWDFASRGNEVYARFNGTTKKAKRASVRGAK